MILAIGRSLGAIVVGLVPASLFVIAVEIVGEAIYPFPADKDPHDMKAVCAHVARLPSIVLLIGVVGWNVGTFLSSWLATRLGTRQYRAHGIGVGSFFFLMAVTNMVMLPYPIWFWGANLVGLPAATLFGARLGSGASRPLSPAA